MDYIVPTGLEEAFGHLARGPVHIVAGGTDYYPSRRRGALACDLLDVTRIAELQGVTRGDAGWRIGAATRWSDVIHADLPPAFNGLKAAAREVGSIQIQNAGTVAGNLCNASPAADGVPPLLTLDAQVELGSSQGLRMLALSDFITGPRRTALQPGEMVTAIHVPEPPNGATSGFAKLGARRYLVISITMTAALLTLDQRGFIAEARVAVGACSPVACRLPALEASLIGQDPSAPSIDSALLSPLAPIDDVRGSAAYRADAVSEQIAEALRAAGGKHG
ncbi:FAD binding domain-containing protein [Lutimaribacter marinistellae]|uniref:FAD binding domain-containing protein n=1 Tax=Lutimaribacter marinistellae TaxID=1820329 RepID=A0ABV7TFD7_9RHOB